MASVIGSNNAFAFDLYTKLATGDSNFVMSPSSISEALSMTLAGARGRTAKGLASALRLKLPSGQVHGAWAAIRKSLEGADSTGADHFTLSVVNELWPATGLKIERGFRDIVRRDYSSELRKLDYSGDPEGSRTIINNEIADQTHSRIRNLLPKNSVGNDTAFVLTNAVYFEALWSHRLRDDGELPFKLLDGTTPSVPVMTGSALGLRLAQEPGYDAAQVPYRGGRFSMLLVAPEEGHFNSFEKSITSAMLTRVDNALHPTIRSVVIPKFKFDAKAKLKQALTKLGAGVAFGRQADFSGITGDMTLFLDEAYHSASIQVDEKGTIAAAATGVVGVPFSSAPPPIVFDRPFLFAIRDGETGEVLFLGRLTDPSAR